MARGTSECVTVANCGHCCCNSMPPFQWLRRKRIWLLLALSSSARPNNSPSARRMAATSTLNCLSAAYATRHHCRNSALMGGVRHCACWLALPRKAGVSKQRRYRSIFIGMAISCICSAAIPECSESRFQISSCLDYCMLPAAVPYSGAADCHPTKLGYGAWQACQTGGARLAAALAI